MLNRRVSKSFRDRKMLKPFYSQPDNNLSSKKEKEKNICAFDETNRIKKMFKIRKKNKSLMESKENVVEQKVRTTQEVGKIKRGSLERESSPCSRAPGQEERKPPLIPSQQKKNHRIRKIEECKTLKINWQSHLDELFDIRISRIIPNQSPHEPVESLKELYEHFKQ